MPKECTKFLFILKKAIEKTDTFCIFVLDGTCAFEKLQLCFVEIEA